ncbi:MULTISPECIES: helix-turn-helix domain-containing protein [Streptomyces]|uniref:helix-turn-helix domain-containing protein n=1 Tax=Streptomyces TaxID=1883 RepID=UPI0019623C4E|nr:MULTISPECIES: helix-turn-helix transcriptional regulator [Streptomyces]QRX92694.1 helix-turn-helix transcriptional regulator [Streptomyces noursei]UJB42416.1 helix-turn-helix transcriptional regulator [Streptomyces sp. A1-5]
MPPRKDADPSASVPCFYGAEMRFLREQAGLTLEQLAEGSYRGISLLSQIERGERSMPLDLALHVDKKLNTNGFFERRCEAAAKARRAGHAEYFADALEMEQRAETIEEWAPMLVPGLLQTPDYTRAVVRAAMPRVTDDEVEEKVTARMSRAVIFDAEAPPKFWVILSESLVRRPALQGEQMAELLEHIARVVRTTHSILQLLPEYDGLGPFAMGMAKFMTFADAPPVLYVESLHSGQLIDYPPLVKQYRESYDLLRAAALSPAASLSVIETAAGDYRNGKQSARLE